MASAALIFGRPPPIHPSSLSAARLSSLFFTARVCVWNARAQPRCCDWRTEAARGCDWSIESGLILLRARVECYLYTEAQLQRKRTKETGEKRPRNQEKISPQKFSIIRVL